MTRMLGRQRFGDPANAGKWLTENEALELLVSWVPNEKLRNHMFQVGWLLRSWAEEKEGLDEIQQWKWQVTGWLHDADWERWPETHCQKIVEELEQRQTDPEVIHAIASHGPAHFGVEPSSKLDKMLYAFDELSGFVHAYSLMRPGGYKGMETKGVLKRLKDKTFAAQVSREDIRDAADRIPMPVEELIAFVISHQAVTPQVTSK